VLGAARLLPVQCEGPWSRARVAQERTRLCWARAVSAGAAAGRQCFLQETSLEDMLALWQRLQTLIL
jgi:hypothetical protein